MYWFNIELTSSEIFSEQNYFFYFLQCFIHCLVVRRSEHYSVEGALYTCLDTKRKWSLVKQTQVTALVLWLPTMTEGELIASKCTEASICPGGGHLPCPMASRGTYIVLSKLVWRLCCAKDSEACWPLYDPWPQENHIIFLPSRWKEFVVTNLLTQFCIRWM